MLESINRQPRPNRAVLILDYGGPVTGTAGLILGSFVVNPRFVLGLRREIPIHIPTTKMAKKSKSLNPADAFRTSIAL